jgi:hypothetical protein
MAEIPVLSLSTLIIVRENSEDFVDALSLAKSLDPFVEVLEVIWRTLERAVDLGTSVRPRNILGPIPTLHQSKRHDSSFVDDDVRIHTILLSKNVLCLKTRKPRLPQSRGDFYRGKYPRLCTSK